MKKIYKKPVTQLHLTATGKDIMQTVPSLSPHSNDFGDIKQRDDEEFEEELEAIQQMEHTDEWSLQRSLW